MKQIKDMAERIEFQVFQKLILEKSILSSVESCTGGLIAHRLTGISGASEVFWGAHVVYDNSAKAALGVPPEVIEKHGAVSAEVAESLAIAGLAKLESALKSFGSRNLLAPKELLCIATTGIAGPGGGSPEKPVGLCYLGLASNLKPVKVEKFLACSDDSSSLSRDDLKFQFSEKALAMVLANDY